jgi:DNA-binding NarL/FixJ family response regulator
VRRPRSRGASARSAFSWATRGSTGFATPSTPPSGHRRGSSTRSRSRRSAPRFGGRDDRRTHANVASLAAQGQTNRDIAQALFVTPKTVEVHLSNAYRKLGIRSRRDLPRVLVATSPA